MRFVVVKHQLTNVHTPGSSVEVTLCPIDNSKNAPKAPEPATLTPEQEQERNNAIAGGAPVLDRGMWSDADHKFPSSTGTQPHGSLTLVLHPESAERYIPGRQFEITISPIKK